MKIIGHRGASEDAPENTLEALQLAWAQGAYGAECDITRTRDGKLVLMHDDSTKRTARGGVDLLVEGTDWDELKGLDVGSWKDPKWLGVKIPLLEEVLRAIPEGKHLYVEVKSGSTNLGADARVLNELENLLATEEISPEKITFISFDHDFLNRLKKRLPRYNAYYLTTYRKFPGKWPEVRNMRELKKYIQQALENGIDGLDLESSSVIAGEWVKKIHEQGLKVTIWGYRQDDTLEKARRYQEMGVDFFTTNTPARILAGLALQSSGNSSLADDDLVQNGKITPLGIDYLLRFKQFNLFSKASTAFLFTFFLPIIIPLALLRLLALFLVFGGGILLKKYLAIHLEDYPKISRIIFFVCLGIIIRAKAQEEASTGKNERCTVIITNHPSRFDAVLLASLHQADATYLAAAKSSFFGRLIMASGLCSRAMEEGIALDTQEGREEWRRRLNAAAGRPLLFFPEGRVVQKPETIITFQNHLLYGQKVTLICKKSRYKSYFLDHTQIEIPFFKTPYSRFKNKLLWDSIIEGLPFLVSFVTVFETEVLGTVQLNGKETPEEIDDALYSFYLANGFRLVAIDPLLVKKLLQSFYR